MTRFQELAERVGDELRAVEVILDGEIGSPEEEAGRFSGGCPQYGGRDASVHGREPLNCANFCANFPHASCSFLTFGPCIMHM